MRSTILPGQKAILNRGWRYCISWRDLIDSQAEELAKIASQEMGKLIKQSRGEVKLCAQIARYYADNAKSFLAAPVKYPSELGEAWVEHHPIGVLLAVEAVELPLLPADSRPCAKPGGR